MYKKWVIGVLLIAINVVLINTIQAEDIQSTYASPCDQTEDISKTIFMEAGKEKEICIRFVTASEEPVRIVYGFINKDLDADGDPVCAVNVNKNDMFNNIFLDNTQRSITINKDTPSLVKEKIRIPLGVSWSIVWCMTYTTENIFASWIAGMLNLVVRKVFPLSFFAGSGEAIKNSIEVLKNWWGEYSTDSKVKAIVDTENNLSLGFLVHNKGNVSQDIIITGKISNFLGFEKEFSTQQIIAWWNTGDLSSNVWLLPWYKWLFTIKYTINNTPTFDFDASSIDEKYKQPGKLSGNGQIFIFSWIMVIAIAVVLLIIIRFFWPRKRAQQYIQPTQTVAQPMQQ